MQLEKLTRKAAEALQSAQELAMSKQHAQLETVHLLHALIHQADGLVPRVVRRIDANYLSGLRTLVDTQLAELPTLTGDYELMAHQDIQRVLKSSEQVMQEMQDSYITTEHLLLACMQLENPRIKSIQRQFPLLSYQHLSITITTMRN
jgi:ATP-dependent Clp protease ATP-binding subunit ClpB